MACAVVRRSTSRSATWRYASSSIFATKGDASNSRAANSSHAARLSTGPRRRDSFQGTVTARMMSSFTRCSTASWQSKPLGMPFARTTNSTRAGLPRPTRLDRIHDERSESRRSTKCGAESTPMAMSGGGSVSLLPRAAPLCTVEQDGAPNMLASIVRFRAVRTRRASAPRRRVSQGENGVTVERTGPGIL